MELAPEIEGSRLAQVEVQHGVCGIRARDGNLVTLRAELFHAQHALLVQVEAHPLVTALEDRLVHAVGVVFFDDMHVLEPEHFCRADDRRNIVRVEQVLENHAEMPCTAIDHFRQQVTTAFRYTGKQRFQFTHLYFPFFFSMKSGADFSFMIMGTLFLSRSALSFWSFSKSPRRQWPPFTTFSKSILVAAKVAARRLLDVVDNVVDFLVHDALEHLHLHNRIEDRVRREHDCR